MKLNKEAVKGILSVQLKQAGYTLEDAEVALRQDPGMEKTAKGMAEIIKDLASVSLLGAATVGAGIGYGGFQGYKAYNETNDMIDEKTLEREKIRRANQILVDHLRSEGQTV